MVVRSKKKTRKLRGSRTMGWGRVGQHRDRGSQGGRAVGQHKEKWSWTVKYGKLWYGKHGFVNPTKKEIPTINVGELEKIIDKAERKDGKYYLDLSSLGIQKLLGKGDLYYSVIIKVNRATKKAIEKVKRKGGEVILATSE